MVRRLICVFLLFVPLVAFALTLDEARDQGLVGEDATGYVAAVSAKPTKEVQALVDEVNAKRRAAYEQVAKQNSTPTDPVTPDDVARLGAAKLIEKQASGTYIRLAEKGWQKKP